MHRIRTGFPASQTMTVVLLAALLSVPLTARAYNLTGVGGSLGYATPQDLDGTAALGVHAAVEQTGNRVQFDPNVRYWKVDGVRDFAPNADLTYQFGDESHWRPYVGGGLGVNFVHENRFDRSSSDVAVNAIAGLRFPVSAGRYFLEGRYTASDISQVAVVTGITFSTP